MSETSPQRKQIFLFGDQTVELYTSLLDLHRRESESFNLRQFFRIANQALRKEISSSSYWKESGLPTFESLLELAETDSQQSENETSITTVLLCAVQLGHLILLAQNSPSIFEHTSNIKIASICTGGLAAAVLDVATSIEDLLDLAPAILCIAFRTGVAAAQRSSAIERSKESWAILVSAISRHNVTEAIKSFYSKENYRSDKQIFISSSTENSSTISGPPSVLNEFLGSGLLKSARHLRLPLGAIFHAPHLPQPDICTIIQSDSFPHSRYSPKGATVSMSTGKHYDTDTFTNLLTEVISDVLSKPIDLGVLASGLANTVGPSPAVLTSVGPLNCAKYIKRKLQEFNCQMDDPVAAASSHVPAREKYSGNIAIVGMSGRFPGGETLEEFWKVLEDGEDLHKKVPADRFDVDTHCDPTGKLRNSTLTPYGVFMDHPGHFDARMFNMSPREAAQTDPMQRLLLMTTYEALEMSGYSPDRTPSTQSSRIGSFFGQTSDDWREVNAAQDIDTYFITGGIRAFGPGRLNYYYKWEGPSYSVDTACSSSFASIQLACTTLRSLECDTAVAGGANILTASDLFSGLSRGGFLSSTGGCKTFDDDADGYCRGDAVGTVILKRLEDAVEDNDRVLSVIRGVDTNHSAHAVSITHPHSATQQKLFRSVLRQASLLPEDVDYVEMHGTGTQAGDFTELSSVSSVFGKGRSHDRPLYVGTLKPNMGHGEAASGVTSLIKAVTMFRKNMIPPHVGIKNNINHRLTPLDDLGVKLAMKKTPWVRDGDSKRTIVINNFDAAGGNTSLLVEDPPSPRIPQNIDPRQHQVVAISGRTPNALKQNQIRLLQHLRDQDLRLEDLAYTSTARRQHHIYRSAYSCDSVSSLISSLGQDVQQSAQPSRMPESSAVFVFTGQGSEWAGMGKQLYESSSFCRTIFHQHDAICTGLDFPSFLNLLTDSNIDLSTVSPIQIQLAIVSFELTLAALWQHWGVHPSYTIGHSLGEYPAMVTSGILSLSDMFYLVGSRARIIQENCTEGTHSMLAVKLSEDSALRILRQNSSLACSIACANAPTATIISGGKDDIAELKRCLDSQQIKATLLPVRFAFHSPQMDPVLEKYRGIADGVRFTKPSIPFASAFLGAIIETEGLVTSEYLMQQTRGSVHFLTALQALQARGLTEDHTTWLDLGPRPLCLNMVQQTLKVHPSCLISVNDPNRNFWAISAQGLVQSYKNGIDVQWNSYHEEYESSLSLVELPSYAFDLKNYWIQYEGDWSLTKGEKRIEPPAPAAEAFSSTSLQSIESENYQEGYATVVFSSNLAEHNLRTAVCGHSVNGAFLCPSSVYGDMAMTAASYVFSKLYPDVDMPGLDVCHMEVTKPLMANIDGKDQWIKLTVTKLENEDLVNIMITSQAVDDRVDHVACIVKYGDKAKWMSKWSRNAHFVQARIDDLMDGVCQRRTQQILRPMAYRLFSNLVRYDKKFQGMQQVYLDSERSEASAEIEFQSAYSDGDFFFSPYWIDSILHLSGFILNGSEKTPEDTVYISHGWESLRVARALSPDQQYRSYVRMQATDAKGVMAGDIYVFDGMEIVAVCKGLKFQEIKRKILDRLLPPVSAQAERNTLTRPTPTGTISPKAPEVAKIRPISKAILEPSKNQFDEVLEIIASEAEIGMEEFSDNIHLSELGIDSLLAIGIVERIRAHLKDLEIPSSIFFDFPTVADLRTFFSTISSSSSEKDSLPRSEEASIACSMTSTSEIGDFEDLKIPRFSESLRTILAEELEMPESDIQPTTRFVEIGVDSLMALNLVSVIKNKVGKTLDADYFFDYPSFGDVLKSETSESTRETTRAGTPFPSSPPISRANTKYVSESLPRATSNLLQQGLNADSSTPMFLFPDGAGSAASYVALPKIGPTTTVYGLNSPFLKSPTEFNGSLTWVVSLYVDEIRAKQKSGPYILGGWSIGGIYAYEAARQLIMQGEQVIGLVLIDTPCPDKLPPMSMETIDHLEKLGTFDNFATSGGGLSLSVRQHFEGSTRALRKHKLQSIPDSKQPRCLAIWAKNGVLDTNTNLNKSSDNDILSDATSQWIMNTRNVLGGNGWQEWISHMECKFVNGTNHFTMMQRPEVGNVAALISEFVANL